MAQTEEKQANRGEQSVPISGRFDQYRSSFWGAALAAIGGRYLMRPFLKESWQQGARALASAPQSVTKFFADQRYSLIAGGIMEGVTVFFAYKTWKDMRSIFAQSLAWEFNKDPKDVGFADFRKSKNSMVQQTLSNYIKYNLRRGLVEAVFFLPALLGGAFKAFGGKNIHPILMNPEAGVDFGVAANSAYLFNDVVSRRITPFESLQSTIDHKINHVEHFTAAMTGTDLLDIYERHAANNKIDSFRDKRGTPEWEKCVGVFDRMAGLMNQHYKNTPPKEKADFGMSEFIYLVGHHLIQPDNIERTAAVIEVANRHGIPAVQNMIKDLESGKPLAEALIPYPLEPAPAVSETPASKKFTDSVPAPARLSETRPALFTDKIVPKDASEPSVTLSA